MNFRTGIFFSLLIIPTNCFAQPDSGWEVRDVTKATFFNPGISYEKAVARSQSIYGQAFMNTSIGIGYSSSLGNTSSISFDPAATIQYRYYYNYAKRTGQGKRTDMNSLNYVCLIAQTAFSKVRLSDSDYPETNRRAVNTFGLAWGIQRNYESRFSLDLTLGAGYLFAKVTTINDSGELVPNHAGQFTTLLDVNLGFWLNKRQ